MNRTIVWFRRDLRISDHEPLYKAARRGLVIPVFIFDRALLLHPETGAGRVRFMLSCLKSLDEDLRSRGSSLILREGNPVDILPALIRESQADGIYSYLDFERIYGRVRDANLNRALAKADLKIRWFEPIGSQPDFMAYPQYRQFWYEQMKQAQVPTPQHIGTPADIASDSLPALEKLGHVADEKFIPDGGSAAARRLLDAFYRDRKAERYYWQMSYPGTNATSGLSPYIKYGAISVRECAQAVWQYQNDPQWAGDKRVQRSSSHIISRLRWGSGFTQRFRYLPQMEVRSLYTPFTEENPQNGWEPFNVELYDAWRTGHTGFPIVDAAARCLQATGGWLALNFRVRAIYASFLCNLLGIDWRYGALHFMRHLIDGDCPIDHYQWAQQSGVTHCLNQAWTRIYNPEQEAVDRCDPEGHFIHHWMPELAHLKPEQLGTPPKTKGYIAPILDYAQARARRAKRLQDLRHDVIHAPNVLPLVARMPKDVTPFGADLFPSETDWAKQPIKGLYPCALSLDELDSYHAKQLRTWLVVSNSWTNDSRKQPFAKRKNLEKRKARLSSRQLSLLG